MLNTIIIFTMALFTIYWEERQPHYWHYILKPLTMFIIIMVAVTHSIPAFPLYNKFILIGLVCSLGGDIFLMLPQDRFLPGLVSFLLAQISYSLAFFHAAGSLTLWIALPLLIYGGWIYQRLLPHLGKMRFPVLIYILLILVMVFTAINLYWDSFTLLSAMAGIGAVLFVVSDSILAWNRFKQPFVAARPLILGTYFAAQLFIAASIARYH